MSGASVRMVSDNGKTGLRDIGLYVPEKTFLGGRPGISMTVPFGFIDIAAQATGPLGNTVELATNGWGLADMVPRLQLGWDNGDFHHTDYVQGLLPTGRYDKICAGPWQTLEK